MAYELDGAHAMRFQGRGGQVNTKPLRAVDVVRMGERRAPAGQRQPRPV